jgi:hypothetical protein
VNLPPVQNTRLETDEQIQIAVVVIVGPAVRLTAFGGKQLRLYRFEVGD